MYFYFSRTAIVQTAYMKSLEQQSLCEITFLVKIQYDGNSQHDT